MNRIGGGEVPARWLRALRIGARTSVLVMSVLVFALAQIGAGLAGPAPTRGGTLVIGVPGDPVMLNPALTTSAYAHFAGGQLFSALVSHDFDLNPVPQLAVSWQVSDDGMTYTFRLVRNAVWHDGKPLTSADVKFTFEKVLIPFHPSGKSNFEAIESIETPDAYTVVFHLKFPFPAFFTMLGIRNAPIVPKHIYEGTDILKNPRNTKDPIGSGPFVLKEYVPGDHLIMERNDKYFMPGKPYLDRVVLKVIPDGTTRVLALERGEIDFIPRYVPLNEVARLEHNPRLRVVYKGNVNSAAATIYMMLFNLDDPMLAKLKVRQAIAYAIDKREISDKATFGLEAPATGPFDSSIKWAFNPSVTQYAFDPARANQLLDEAGVKRGPGGIRFTLELSLGRGLPDEDRTAELIREQLKKVGINVVLRPVDQAAFIDAVYLKRKYQAAIRAHPAGPDPALAAMATYDSSNIRPVPYGNAMGYANKTVDTLLEAATRTASKEKARQFLFQAQVAIAKDLPALWLRERVYPHALVRTLEGVPSGPSGGSIEALDNAYFTVIPKR